MNTIEAVCWIAGESPRRFPVESLVRFPQKPIRLGETQSLQKQQGSQTAHGVMLQALPASPLKMIQSDFLFEFPVSQFTGPALPSHMDEMLKRRFRWQIAEIELLFTSGPLFTGDPGTFPWKVLPSCELKAVSKTDGLRGKRAD